MIEHLSQIGKAVVVLELLTKREYKTTVIDGIIVVKVQDSWIGTSINSYQFNTEEDYMVWLLKRIKEVAEEGIEWFESHSMGE